MGEASEPEELLSVARHPGGSAEAEASRSRSSSRGRDDSTSATEAPPEKPHGSTTSGHAAVLSGGEDVGSDHVDEAELAECSVEGCNEVLDLVEMVYHLDLHAVLDCQEDDGQGAGQVDERDAADSGDSEPEAGAEADDGADKRLSGQQPRHAPSSSKSSKISKSSKSSNVGNRTPTRIPSRRRNTTSAVYEAGTERSIGGTTAGNVDEPRRRHSQHAKHGHRSRRHSHNVDGTSGHGEHDERPRDHHRERRDKERGHSSTLSQGSLARRLSRSSRSSWWPFRSAAEPKKDTATARSRRPASASSRHKDSSSEAAGAGAPTKSKQRLGKAELGRYAHEERMPDWLAVYLKKEWGVCHSGVIPVLRQLLEQSPTTEYAYLCDPCVTHVSRLQREGGFCGYRNIQTMVSYIVGAKFPGHNLFGDDLPNIFDIQNIIENAWDMGINAHGRIETGGIRWTRKYIGTPEAMAMFRSLNIPCNVQAFNHRKTGRAADLMLREVEQYFEMGKYRPGRKVRATSLPPIYWQHPGHSLTIIGIEKTTAGQTNLLVFDPIIKDGSPIARLVGRQRFEARFPDKLLQLYRRGPRYLWRFKAFELLKLDPRQEDIVQVDGDATPVPSSR